MEDVFRIARNSTEKEKKNAFLSSGYAVDKKAKKWRREGDSNPR